MNNSVLNSIEAIGPSIIAWRRHLHSHPELSFKEKETSAFIEEKLKGFGPRLKLRKLTPTSVVADLAGAAPGKLVALRADIDALPVKEENEVEYRSRNEGVMHACGHDTHAAMLLGIASVMCAGGYPKRGSFRFIFQHAEERFPGGASELVAAGVMDGVDAIVGAHIMSLVPFGRIGVIPGPAMAAPDQFYIDVQGKGGHGSMPQMSIDPVIVACEIVGALQTVVSRWADPLENIVLSVTEVHAGTAENIIPDTASLCGTVRTFKESVRSAVPGVMERIAKGVCAAHGATCSFKYDRGYASVVNEPEATARVEKAIDGALGEGTVIHLPPLMGGEDFSAYLSKAPGTFFLVGGGVEDAGARYPNHHPKFFIDERALPLGAKALATAALAMLE
jgi:amidohydrolase